MIFMKKTVGIYKVGVLTSKLLCFIIHDLGESLLCWFFSQNFGNMLTDSRGCFIGRADQNAIHCLFHGNHFAFIYSHVRTITRHAVHGIMGESDFFIQVAILGRQKTGHDFGRAGGVHLFMNILGIKNGMRIHFH